MSLKSLIITGLFCFISPFTYANDHSIPPLSLYWTIPFIVIIFAIALLPILISTIWHRHYGKIIGGCSLLFIIAYGWQFGLLAITHLICHTVLIEYIPFIILLAALFTVAGGILIEGNFNGSPKHNMLLLAIGTFLASVMGTTGAAMLMIRPIISANKQRQYRVHTIIFFIFLVANIGGGLTPLGDPPLFIGFLNGVDFIWTLKHMSLPVLINTALLLILFYNIDGYYYRKDCQRLLSKPTLSLTIKGKTNFIILFAIIVTILATSVWQSDISINILGTTLTLPNIIRDMILVILTLLSLMTSKSIREQNQFNWQPIIEVAKLFIGIFITISPVIAILKMGKEGSLSNIISLVTNDYGEPINLMYFWLSGLLSGFLDNAPTYLVFFNLASGSANFLMQSLPTTLLAISMGSVFMGALTYIGNAPNFMVKSIAEQSGFDMPSFFGYMRWSIGLLMPIFLIDSLLFFIL
ncbi:sodium:proton antiporter [Frischella sp. Ac48]|uniref:Sodium:proton antiporter n=1 Tax=Frischella japonica TaxID=2741544 RepID=A0ABR7QVA9_9GAMM|nr:MULTISPECIES: sodium:proton antiporter [Frischella]MBC9130121.1 sodium:proton antiporter [Frischella japonica]MBX4133105.1 sodium:proton antiporter [Frischella sp. Ac48]